jgi:hypothetical protein
MVFGHHSNRVLMTAFLRSALLTLALFGACTSAAAHGLAFVDQDELIIIRSPMIAP